MVRTMEIAMPAALDRILRQTPELARAFLAGGCVRDALLGYAPKDFDVEVYGVTYERLVAALSKWGKTDLVGRSFGVVKLFLHDGAEYDFSLARKDSKTAPGHKGFAIEFTPELTLEEATARRDFTINSLLFDPRKKQVIDLHNGQSDLEQRILRHTSAAFVEDPLRVLRGFQFAARFELRAAPETIELCRSIKHSIGELAKERVWHEWCKWSVKSVKPSVGLLFLRDCEWLEHYPEIGALIGTPQDPRWHPEGDVFAHTCHCLDAMARLPEWQRADDNSRIVLMFAILAHDFGKATTTLVAEDGISSAGHESASAPLAENFLERIGSPLYVRERVAPLVVNHMFHTEIVTDRSVRRLARRLAPESVESLAILMTADSMGRPPRPQKVPAIVESLRVKATELDVQANAPKPILQGRHLIERGLRPGPNFSPILEAAFEAQLDGEFKDVEGALAWLTNYLEEPR
ncbi:MAG TPA: HD domain-containing protein [Verrucomicrobiae bacterium]|nr:HD domain-containing protein [Verrucomicrobiae bacterium]